MDPPAKSSYEKSKMAGISDSDMQSAEASQMGSFNGRDGVDSFFQCPEDWRSFACELIEKFIRFSCVYLEYQFNEL
jgi:hypothetical protein